MQWQLWLTCFRRVRQISSPLSLVRIARRRLLVPALSRHVDKAVSDFRLLGLTVETTCTEFSDRPAVEHDQLPGLLGLNVVVDHLSTLALAAVRAHGRKFKIVGALTYPRTNLGIFPRDISCSRYEPLWPAAAAQ